MKGGGCIIHIPIIPIIDLFYSANSITLFLKVCGQYKGWCEVDYPELITNDPECGIYNLPRCWNVICMRVFVKYLRRYPK